jgi:hypothetical protein
MEFKGINAKFKLTTTFAYARCKMSHGMCDGIAVLRMEHERRAGPTTPWGLSSVEYIIAGTTKDFKVKNPRDIPVMVEAFKAGKKSFKL